MNISIENVIEKVDEIRPNVFTYQQKKDWICNLEYRIIEFKNLYSDTLVDFNFENEDNPTLCLDKDNIDIYVFYLLSMMCIATTDIAMYNNYTSIFNKLYDIWQKKYRREHIPSKNTKITGVR